MAGRGVADITRPLRASVALIGRHRAAFLALYFLEDRRFLEDLAFAEMVQEWEQSALARTIASAELVMPDE